jgi:uncharacterized phage protein gp47/JayE
MTIFTPRTPESVLRDLVSKVVSRTELSDVSVGSTLFTLLNAVALEVSNTEARLSNIKRGFSIQNASGSELDARVAELPPVGIARKTNINSSGSVLTINRDQSDVLDDLLIPAGSIVQRGDNGIQYRTASDNIIPAGFDSIDNVYIICTTPGIVGNCQEGVINTITSMPDAVISVNNTGAISNGQNYEDDTSLRARAMRYVNSIGRVSKSSLEFIGTTYKSVDNVSFKFARVYEDPFTPGYSELVVDDGTGLRNPGIQITDTKEVTVPSGGMNYITHARPAIAPLNTGNIVVERNGSEIQVTENDFVSLPERGLVFFREGFLEESDVVTIRGIRVYTGLIAELQREIEGNSSNGAILTGFRSAGCRVRVVPPTITDFKVSVNITVQPGEDPEIIKTRVKNATIDYVNNIDIGKELIPSRLVTHLIQTQKIISCDLNIFGTQTKLETVYPASAKHVLRTKTDFITIESRG